MMTKKITTFGLHGGENIIINRYFYQLKWSGITLMIILLSSSYTLLFQHVNTLMLTLTLNQILRQT